jgi:hypothetical protein
MRSAVLAVVCLGLTGPSWAQDLEVALAQARQLVEAHRYQEVLELLAPFAESDDEEARYVVAAETGRAYYHLGDYQAANTAFREAVTLRPQRVETALYLQATSYLTGDHELAYRVFRELLESGATDLYLAVTLPGERRFFADPVVWEILDEYVIEVKVDVNSGSVLGVEFGQHRSDVETRLGAGPVQGGSTLTARAGPFLTWAFGFDANNALDQIMLHNDHLSRYTPYRLRLTSGFDWTAGPEAATTELGAPSTTSTEGDFVVMEWHRDGVRLILEFAPPRAPVPPGINPDRPALRVVKLQVLETPVPPETP